MLGVIRYLLRLSLIETAKEECIKGFHWTTCNINAREPGTCML